jgi:hypothetical protein
LNAQLQAQLTASARIVQGYAGETLMLAGVDYTVTAAEELGGHLDLVQGGAFEMRSIRVCLLQADLPAAPAVNTPCIFRFLTFRVRDVSDASGIYWTLTLEQQFA